VTNKLLTGHRVGDLTYKVHLDGYNLVPYLSGQVTKSPRESFFYINDDQQLTSLRYDNWKFVFMEQRGSGAVADLGQSFHQLEGPEDIQSPNRSLRAGGHHVEYVLRLAYRSRLPVNTRAGLRRPIPSHVQGFSPRQKAATFNMDEVLAKLKEAK
jgi:hypothetical protein